MTSCARGLSISFIPFNTNRCVKPYLKCLLMSEISPALPTVSIRVNATATVLDAGIVLSCCNETSANWTSMPHCFIRFDFHGVFEFNCQLCRLIIFISVKPRGNLSFLTRTHYTRYPTLSYLTETFCLFIIYHCIVILNVTID